MKKVILTLVLALGLSSFANAQCGENSTYIQASCVSGCYSVYTMSGNMESDITPRKPTLSQATEIEADLNRRCSTFSGRATIDEPGTV